MSMPEEIWRKLRRFEDENRELRTANEQLEKKYDWAVKNGQRLAEKVTEQEKEIERLRLLESQEWEKKGAAVKEGRTGT